MKTQIKEVVYRDDSIENRKNFFEYLTHFNRKKNEIENRSFPAV
jgi:hypothetical protein